MRLSSNAGEFEAEAWTDGSPHWVTIKRNGEVAVHGMHPDALHDLRYVVDRMIAQLEKAPR